jgi:hypothetical protein
LAPSEEPERPTSGRKEIDVDPETLADYVGTYKLGPGWLVTVALDGDSLMAQATNESRFPMVAMSDSVFWVEAYGAAVQFRRDASGSVSRIEYRGIEAPRVELVTPTPAELAEYVGHYHSPELDTNYEIVLQEDQLIARHWKNGEIRLSPTLRDEFGGSAWFLRNVEFVRGTDAQVKGLRVTNGRVRNLRFEKMAR